MADGFALVAFDPRCEGCLRRFPEELLTELEIGALLCAMCAGQLR